MAARQALEEFDARRAAADAEDRAAAVEVTNERQREYDDAITPAATMEVIEPVETCRS